jgi:prepilin-type N-terminal cleavage/methylation domain-containing protein
MTNRAFTMLELVFVIIILGIVSSIGGSVIAKIYENYLIQKSIHSVSIKTELAAEQIANRLQFSMSRLVVARNPTDATDVVELFRATGNDENRTILEWIAYDNDSFTAQQTPGWSGYADLNSSSRAVDANGHSILTPGSNLNLTDTIMRNLSGDRVSTNPLLGANRPNLIFSGDIPFQLALGADTLYRTTCLGLGNPVSTVCSIPITTTSFANAHDRINFTNAAAINMGEFYKLAWSAYALVPTPRGDGAFDLALHSNYQPWAGETYVTRTTTINTLIKNVTVFKFMESAGTLRFKLCARSFITNTNDFVSSCKEKVITR